MLSDRGWLNDNNQLNGVERDYVEGPLRTRKIEAIKRIRNFTECGLKDAKDLSEIWDGSISDCSAVSVELLRAFGYYRRSEREKEQEKLEQEREQERLKAADNWIELWDGAFQRTDQITFINFSYGKENNKESIALVVEGGNPDEPIVIRSEYPKFWENKSRLQRLVGLKPNKEKIAEDEKCGRRFKID